MAINPEQNINALRYALSLDKLIVTTCKDVATGKDVTVLGIIYEEENNNMFIPVARLFIGNPYHEIYPPESLDGFKQETQEEVPA